MDTNRFAAAAAVAAALLAAILAVPAPAAAHHGWSSYETSQPLYLRGTLRELRWENPHVELELGVAADVTLPPELPDAELPPQFEADGGRAILSAAILPPEPANEWHVVLAPIRRMESWGVLDSSMPPLGATVAVVAYQSRVEPDEVRAEALIFEDGSVIPLRRNAETPQEPRPAPAQPAPTAAAPASAPSPTGGVEVTAPTASPTGPPAPTAVAQAATPEPAAPTPAPSVATSPPPARSGPPLLLGAALIGLVAIGALLFLRRRG